MTGSEKQIKWATDILNQTLATAQQKIESATKNIEEAAAAGKRARFSEKFKAQAEQITGIVSEILSSDIDAGYIIDRRHKYGSYDIFLDYAREYDYDVARIHSALKAATTPW